MDVKKPGHKMLFAKALKSSPFSALRVSVFFVAVGFVLLFTSWVNKDFASAIRQGGAAVLAPAVQWAASPVFAVRDMFNSATDLVALRAQNAQLVAENEKLKNWYHAAQALNAENARLSESLGYADLDGRDVITARVMADSSRAFLHSVIVSAGAQDGVEKNQAVLSFGAMVGRVIAVGETTSRILLLQDHSARVPVLITALEEGGENIRAIMAGNNSATPDLLHLPSDIHLSEGQRVITSGHGGVLPPDLSVGRVIPAKEPGYYKVVPDQNGAKANLVQIVKYDSPVKNLPSE